MPRIISVSRRTDVPAFHQEWFMDCIRKGEVTYRHPFNGKPIPVSLNPEEVAALVFWSKDYRPLIPHLEELDRRGYRLLFHFTITGLPSFLETNVPATEETLSSFRYLARRYSPKQVLWRYDPVFLGEGIDSDFHRENFLRLCRSLEGFTERCYLSFVQSYSKVTSRLAKNGLEMKAENQENQRQLAQELAAIAEDHGMTLYACCSDYLLGGRVKKARCIDAQLLQELFGTAASTFRRRPSRPSCGCSESTDLGQYHTCRHHCLYCYANR